MRRLAIFVLLLSTLAPAQIRGRHRLVTSGGGGGGAAFVRGGTFDLASMTPTTTQALGWTVGTGNFLIVSFNDPGCTATVYARNNGGGTDYTMGAADATISNTSIYNFEIYHLSNTAAGIDTIKITETGCSGSQGTISVAEYSGVSTTATSVAAGVTGAPGFQTTTTWTNSAYTVPAGGASVLIATASQQASAGGTWGNNSSAFTLRTSGSTSGGIGSGVMIEDQLNVAAGNYTGTGTYSLGGSGTRYAYITVGYK